MPIRSYYDVLGVPRHASAAEIKFAYRAAAMRWHPDRNPSPGALARFRDVAEADQCLSRDETRAAYDLGLQRAEARAQAAAQAWYCSKAPIRRATAHTNRDLAFGSIAAQIS